MNASMPSSKQVLENLSVPVFTVSTGLTVQVANRLARERFGWTRQAISQNAVSLLSEPELLCLEPLIRGMFGERTHEAGAAGFALSLLEGETASDAVAVTVLDSENKAATARRDALLAAAIEQSDELVLVADDRGAVRYVNPAYQKTIGQPRTQRIGRSWKEWPGYEVDPRRFDEIQAAMFSGEVWKGDIILNGAPGARVELKSTFSPVRDKKGGLTHFIGVMRDVSRESDLERQLNQVQKMQAIGTLAGGIAHDFNNILYSILGNTDLTLDDVPKDSPAYENLQEVMKAGRRATDLVSQILAFSKQNERERAPLQLQSMIKGALKFIRGSLPSTIEIRQNVDPRCGTILAQPSQIHQVIVNLCTNAYHAMRAQGGVLEVAVSEVVLDEGFVASHPGRKPGRYAKLVVRDTGHGMDAVTLDRVFEPYFSTKEREVGVGLGLATVYGIVSNHDGLIEVTSALARGTTVNVYFPLVEEKKAPPKQAPRASTSPDRRRRVLFVDDEAAIVRMACRVLERRGFEVLAFSDSLEAYESFAADPTGFDVVITDQTMPHLTGTQLAKKILELRPDMPVVLSTGFSEDLDEQTVKAFGIQQFVMKPIVPKELEKAIHEAIDSGEDDTSASEREG